MSSADQNSLKENNAPSTDTLATMTPEAIYTALTTGAMVQQASKLTDDEKRVIAEFFGGRPLSQGDAGDARNMSNRCAANPELNINVGAAWRGWGNGLTNTRFQPAKAAGISADAIPRLKLKWAFGLPNGIVDVIPIGGPALIAVEKGRGNFERKGRDGEKPVLLQGGPDDGPRLQLGRLAFLDFLIVLDSGGQVSRRQLSIHPLGLVEKFADMGHLLRFQDIGNVEDHGYLLFMVQNRLKRGCFPKTASS